jgi:hypothetical protein
MPITRTGTVSSFRPGVQVPAAADYILSPMARNVLAWRGEAAMSALTIRHVTTYRYRQPVAFGEHRMMLRPRDSRDQKVIGATLGITPEPSKLRFDRDTFGDHW